MASDSAPTGRPGYYSPERLLQLRDVWNERCQTHDGLIRRLQDYRAHSGESAECCDRLIAEALRDRGSSPDEIALIMDRLRSPQVC